jgi:glyoxylase-like metal-dependent hydrolase (beta-lactamase superfamily II)
LTVYLGNLVTTAFLLPDDIHVFERGWLSSNNIFFDDGQTSWLIDSGYSTHSGQTLALVDAKLGTRPLDVLINTHLHSDHCGGNRALQDKYPSLITHIPPGQAEDVKNWNASALTYHATGQQCPRFSYSQTLLPGSSIRLGSRAWDIYAAPGHDPDAILLFEPDHRILISGDALWENGFGVIFPELEGANAFDLVLATLDLIESLQPQTVIPGHGRAFSYTQESMKAARQRLQAFVQSPARHARHAVKVLLKFKLLEVQQQPILLFNEWAQRTPFLHTCNNRFFNELDFPSFIKKMCAELVSSGAARMADEMIYNA